MLLTASDYCYAIPNTRTIGLIRGEPEPIRDGLPTHYHLRAEDIAYLYERVTELYEVLYTAFLFRDIVYNQSGVDDLFVLYNKYGHGFWWLFNKVVAFRQLLVNRMASTPFVPSWACYFVGTFSGCTDHIVSNFENMDNGQRFVEAFGASPGLTGCATAITGALPDSVPAEHQVKMTPIANAFDVLESADHIAVVDSIYQTHDTSGVREKTGSYRYEYGGKCTNSEECLQDFVVSTGQVTGALPVGPARSCWNRKPPAEYQTSWQAYVMDDRTYNQSSSTWDEPWTERFVEVGYELFSGYGVWTEVFKSERVKRSVRAACENESTGGEGWGDGVIIRTHEAYDVTDTAIIKENYWSGTVTNRHAEWSHSGIGIFSSSAIAHPCASGRQAGIIVNTSCVYLKFQFGTCDSSYTNDDGETNTYVYGCSNKTLYVAIGGTFVRDGSWTRNSHSASNWRFAYDSDELISKGMDIVVQQYDVPHTLLRDLYGMDQPDMTQRPVNSDLQNAITTPDGDHDRLSVFRYSLSVTLVNPIMGMFTYSSPSKVSA